MSKLNELRKELNELQEEKTFLMNQFKDTLHVIYPPELKKNEVAIWKKENEIKDMENRIYNIC